MTLYDIVAAGPVLFLDRESGILASYADGRVLVYEYRGQEHGKEFDKAGLVPSYELLETYLWEGGVVGELQQLRDYAKICAGEHS